MNLPSDTPRLPKWIFLTGDAALLATAWVIYDQSSTPFTGLALLSFAACVIAAAVIGVIPFVSDYARKQDEALDDRQRSLQALSVTVAASAEQIAIAATGLQGIAEAAQENFAKSEALSKAISERMAELKAALEGSKKEGSEAAARLEAAAKAVAAAVAGVEATVSKASHAAQESHGRSEALSKQVLEKVAELRAQAPAARKDESEVAARLEAAAKKLAAAATTLEGSAARPAEAVPGAAAGHAPEVPPVPPSRIVEIKPAVASSFSPFEVAAEPATPAKAVEPAPEAAPAPEPAITAPSPAPRKRGPRKAAAPPAPAPEPAPAPAPDPVAEPKLPESDAQLSPPELAESAVSADGATRLIVTAYIGIGNRLFIRGEGPGLSWERGVPLSFVSIGKWRWETSEATKAVRFKLFKNDEAECSALGELTVEPGAQQELTAVF